MRRVVVKIVAELAPGCEHAPAKVGRLLTGAVAMHVPHALLARLGIVRVTLGSAREEGGEYTSAADLLGAASLPEASAAVIRRALARVTIDDEPAWLALERLAADTLAGGRR